MACFGHGRVGGAVADRLRRAGVLVAVVEADLHLVQHLRRQGIPTVYGDASCPSVLRAVHPEHARLVVVALADAGTTRAVVADVRRSNPTVPILARAARAQDDEPLRPARASGVVAPERAGAELLVEQALSVLRVPAA